MSNPNPQNLPVTQKVANIRQLLDRSKRQLEMALPRHLTADRLLRVAMTSIQRTPKLLDCTPQSLLACVMTCAQLGLEPDQFLGQAYLIPFGKECTLIPGYRGYIALARRSGEVQSVSAQVVYSRDNFILQYGIDEKLEHVPYEPTEDELEKKDPRGKFRGAYVIFKYKDGSYSFDYMNKAEIDRIKKRSKAATDGPWVTDYDEMAKKTVIKRHSKLAPLSVEFQRAVALEDRAMSGESQMDLLTDDDTGVIEGETVAESQEELVKKFDASTPADIDQKKFKEFMDRTAAGNKCTVDELKAKTAQDEKVPDLLKVYNAWFKQVKRKEAQSKKNADAGETSDEYAPGECPNSKGMTPFKSVCDKCSERTGCPAWEKV